VSLLLSPLTLRGTTFRNRIWLAPMCQYSAAADGLPNDWHLAHLGARAVGGFGLVLTEAAAIVPEGRISPQDVGIWNDEQVAAWRRITDFLRARGAHSGIQLAHAGRKASTYRFDEGRGTVPADQGGWTAVGPTADPFAGYDAPHQMSEAEILAVPGQFAAAARRALAAGFDVVEVHAAHGYLLHQFLSPLSNSRTDRWGGDLAARAQLLLDTIDAVRAVLPDTSPLLVRVSATDWTDGGLTGEDTAVVAGWLREHGVDLVDVSTGGNVHASIPVGPGYQVPFARQVRDTGIASGAVGLITTPHQAEKVLSEGDADVVLLGRPALFDPSWPLRAARELGDDTPTLAYDRGTPQVEVLPGQPTGWAAQYARGSWD
jgi:2,4-dienoyl-CoA reductase-like NADH-dependent reductase (Old Yellow Enzyme family)